MSVNNIQEYLQKTLSIITVTCRTWLIFKIEACFICLTSVLESIVLVGEREVGSINLLGTKIALVKYTLNYYNTFIILKKNLKNHCWHCCWPYSTLWYVVPNTVVGRYTEKAFTTYFNWLNNRITTKRKASCNWFYF